ncbi:MAG: FHA domain-containing protein [Deltaproteobacteria bacterium]|nr:FHA domain-containing protein [Deltaproteobacteria bacterium]
MCGHESPAGSSFCLNCGSSLAAPAAPQFVQTATPPPGLPTICGVCRGENPPGMKFCRSCGSALAVAASTLPGGGGGGPLVPPAGAPMMAPPSGGAMGMMGGAPMMPPPYMAPPHSLPAFSPPPQMGGMAPVPGQLPSTAPGMLPPTGASGSSPKPAAVSAPINMITCPRCGTPTPVGFAYCQQCGLHMQAMQPTDPGQNPRPRAPSSGGGGPGSSGGQAASGARPIGNPAIDPMLATLATDGVRAGSLAPPSGRPVAPEPAPSAAAGPAWGTAVLVNRDGSDGQRFTLAGEYSVVGRSGADIAFEDDRFLARQHARFERGTEGVTVHSLDTLNGVFKKADLPVELVDGMTILVGREVLRYETVDPEETKVHPLIRHGVALFGSPPREPWGRFVQIVPSGGYRDVRHLAGEEIVLGREEGDIVFRDDAFMSRRHAAVTWDGKKAQITDLGSSNGTFVRITGPTAIKSGDHVRMGDQLLRIELTK